MLYEISYFIGLFVKVNGGFLFGDSSVRAARLSALFTLRPTEILYDRKLYAGVGVARPRTILSVRIEAEAKAL